MIILLMDQHVCVRVTTHPMTEPHTLFASCLGFALVAGCTASTSVDSGVDADIRDASADALVRETGPSVWDGGSPFGATDLDKIDVVVISDYETFYSAYVSVPLPWILRAMISERPGLDLRFAVLDPDMGDPVVGAECDATSAEAGRFALPRVACTELEARRFVELGSSFEIADVAPEFICRAAGRCAYQQPFDALLSAMLPSYSDVVTNAPVHSGDTTHADFFRHDAFLAVLIVTTPDDCSFDASLSDLDEHPFVRCIQNEARLRPVTHYVNTLLRIRPATTFGVFAVSNIPGDLSGAQPSEILADPRMTTGTVLEAQFAISDHWSDERPIHASGGNGTVSRRIVQLLAGLQAEGVRVGVFSAEGPYGDDARTALEGAAAPIARSMLGLD